MSSHDNRPKKPVARQKPRPKPIFDHLEAEDGLRLKSGPPAPLRDLFGDLDAAMPVRSEQPRVPPAPQPTRSPDRAPQAPCPMPRVPSKPLRAHDDDDAENLFVIRQRVREAEADVFRAERLAAPPAYPRYGRRTTPPVLPILTLRNPIALVLIALVSILVIATLGPNNPIAQFSRWAAPAQNNGAEQGPANSIVENLFGPPARDPGDYDLQAAPSLDPAQIDTILAGYGSPAAGTGQIWHDLGRKYGIDPAFAVAFFIHESSAGTNPGWAGFKPDGSTTHNVGNIICAGYATCYGRFRDYASWEEGINDWYRLIDVEYIEGRGTVTVNQIIPIYAPSFENNVQGYVNAVNNLVDSWKINGVQ